MTTTTERIETSEGGYVDAWVCICGNMPHTDGFYPCLVDGTEVEPDEGGPWDQIRYVCSRCGRVIDQRDGTVLSGPREGDANPWPWIIGG